MDWRAKEQAVGYCVISFISAIVFYLSISFSIGDFNIFTWRADEWKILGLFWVICNIPYLVHTIFAYRY